MAITLGTASPRAQGQDATNTPIPRSTTQQMSHIGTVTFSKKSRSVQTVIVSKLRIMTPLTNRPEIFLQTAWIPASLFSYWFCANLICVPISIRILFSRTFSTITSAFSVIFLTWEPDSNLSPFLKVTVSSQPVLALWTAWIYPLIIITSTRTRPMLTFKMSFFSIKETS